MEVIKKVYGKVIGQMCFRSFALGAVSWAIAYEITRCIGLVP